MDEKSCTWVKEARSYKLQWVKLLNQATCRYKRHLKIKTPRAMNMSGHRSAVSYVRVTSCFADFDQRNGFTGIAATGAVLKLRSIDLYEVT